ncbi:hypothetical protein COCNU_03G012800 [Cocos nucifera]|uniref:DUF7722 domain-containing protein n=1 Tax=Cocos nucifera TaxID=13894 RepID=A0A8K0I438_COCNU|nr:hypothetical protein COCNU_03G012800 [Cocos nucifera]
MEWLTNRNPAETNGVSHYGKERCGGYFLMPLHYPRYTKADYQTMPEWKVDRLLRDYGLPVFGDLAQKRDFAMGTFLWTR